MHVVDSAPGLLMSPLSLTVDRHHPEGGRELHPIVVSLLVVVAAGVAAAVATHVDDTAALLAFAGAMLVAFITWYATDRRQAMAIAAERVKLDVQLDQARKLSDLAQLRTVLDETLAAIESHVHRLGRLAREREPEADTALKREVDESVPIVTSAIGRLHLRLVNDALFEPLAGIASAVDALTDAATKGNADDYRAARDTFSAAQDAFIAAAAKRVRVLV